MIQTHQRTRIIASWAVLLLFVLLTDPSHVPVPLLVIPFILLFVALYFSLCAVLTKYTSLQITRMRRVAASGASIGVITAALQSLGQLTLRDVIVAAALIAVGYFYIGRTADHK
jgi:hypothetical protein